jgi:hypothetical protein
LYDISLGDVDISEEIGEEKVIYHLVSKMSFNKSSKKIDRDGFTSEITGLKGVSKVKVRNI